MNYRAFRSLVYQSARRLYHEIGGTGSDERWWRRRSPADLSAELPITHPHRQWLVDRLAEARPFSSMLEFGCGTGPNLELILNTWGDVHCSGIEINSYAVAAANQRLGKYHDRVHIAGSSHECLASWPTKSVDVVLTDASLLYVGPDLITYAVTHLVRIARKKLYVLELSDSDATGLGRWAEDGWLRNYKELLSPFAAAVEIQKVPPSIFPGGRWPLRGFLTIATIHPTEC